ncbi:MAG: copper amine oxidase N-terminal domain-containing protein, partial [Bacillota bacterium]
MKKFLILLSVFLLTFGLFCTSAQAADNIQITVDGKNVTFTDAKPYMDSNNRVMVPMRTLGEALGCKVDYIASQSIYDANIGYYQSNPEIILTKYTKSGLKAVSCYDPNNETPSCFYIENHHMYYIYLDTDIAGKQSRTYLPARHVAENFGYNVTWDNNTQTVVVTTNKDNILFNHTNNTVSKKDLYGKWVKTNYAGSVYGYVEFTENTYTTSGVDYSKNSYI